MRAGEAADVALIGIGLGTEHALTSRGHDPTEAVAVGTGEDALADTERNQPAAKHQLELARASVGESVLEMIETEHTAGGGDHASLECAQALGGVQRADRVGVELQQLNTRLVDRIESVLYPPGGGGIDQ